ncbi:MAG: hypothetical protein BIFFINMI_02725 [Phycisphaerae bacterium]|nr:hypothetical protein [Phycisphaerae bacterium]
MLRVMFLSALAASVAALSCGCEEPGYYFRPVDHQAGLSPDGSGEQAGYVLAADGGHAAVVALTAQGGLIRREVPGTAARSPQGVVVVRVRVHNRVSRPVALAVGDLKLVDDEGNAHAVAEVLGREEVKGDALAVAPGEAGDFKLLFDLGAGDVLNRLGSFSIDWSARVGDAVQTFSTKFVRSARPEVYYEDYYYAPGPYRGPGPYAPYGYYAYPPGWYDPYRYPGASFHFGYRGGRRHRH